MNVNHLLTSAGFLAISGLMFSRLQAEPETNPSPQITTEAIMRAASLRGEVSALGVSTSSLPSVLKSQMKLTHGLVVDFVQKKSPAEAAGLVEQDILLKIDEQLLFNSRQLTQLLFYYGEGRQVKLSWLHAGERMERTCVIGKPKEPEDEKVEELSFSLHDLIANEDQLTTTIDLKNAFTTIFVPDGSKITMKTVAGKRAAVILNKEGKKVFEGEVENEAQIQLVPELYRSYIKLDQKMLNGKNPKFPSE